MERKSCFSTSWSKSTGSCKISIVNWTSTFYRAFSGGESFINGLPEDIVTILKETGAEAAEYGYEVLKETDQKVLEDFEAQGVEIVEVDTALFKEKVASVYDEFKDEWSDNLYEDLLAELEKLGQ